MSTDPAGAAIPRATGPGNSQGPKGRRSLPSISNVARLRLGLARWGVFASFLVTIVVFGLLRPHTFLSGENIRTILTEVAPMAVVAFGLTVVLSMREFDLSFASLISLAGAVAVSLMSKQGIDWQVAVLLTILVGSLVGLANGVLVTVLGFSSFIATLAMGTILVGIEFTVTNQETIYEGIPSGYAQIGQGDLLGINHQIWIALVVGALAYLLLERTEAGRYMRATGGNPEAAYLAGIPVRLLRTWGFVLLGMTAAVAGILLSSQAVSATTGQGSELLLPAYAAAFLGSTTFVQGQFNLPGTLVGVLFLGVIANGLTLLSATPAAIRIIQGVILLLALLVTRLGGAKATT